MLSLSDIFPLLSFSLYLIVIAFYVWRRFRPEDISRELWGMSELEAKAHLNRRARSDHYSFYAVIGGILLFEVIGDFLQKEVRLSSQADSLTTIVSVDYDAPLKKVIFNRAHYLQKGMDIADFSYEPSDRYKTIEFEIVSIDTPMLTEEVHALLKERGLRSANSQEFFAFGAAQCNLPESIYLTTLGAFVKNPTSPGGLDFPTLNGAAGLRILSIGVLSTDLKWSVDNQFVAVPLEEESSLGS